MSKKILFVNPYPHDKAPSQRLKFETYYDYFRANGYEVEHTSFYDEEAWKVMYQPGHQVGKVMAIVRGYLRRLKYAFKLRQYDIVFIHLWVTPIRPVLYERLYCAIAKRVIYDIDDLVFMKTASHMAWWKKFLKSSQKAIYLMKHARQVLTGTPYLNDFVKQYNQKSNDISVTIDTDVYVPKNDYSNSDKIIVGWSGSLSTSPYMKLLHQVLLDVQKIEPFKLLVMGDAGLKMDGIEDYEAINWSQPTEVPTLQRFDIGLYPLPLDDQWVMGKSGGKALQYMALGIPTIATAIGANFRVIEDGVSGYLVTTPEEWVERIVMLIRDAATRRRVGEAARERIETMFSIKATAPVYLKILNKVVMEPA